MQPIDRQFRFSWDFCVAWALLAVPTLLLTRRLDIGPWYSYYGAIILISLFATFVLYGPILLSRQVVHSGAHGRLVLRVLVSIILTAVFGFVGLSSSGLYSEDNMTVFGFFFVAAAIVYLHWRTDETDGSNGSKGKQDEVKGSPVKPSVDGKNDPLSE